MIPAVCRATLGNSAEHTTHHIHHTMNRQQTDNPTPPAELAITREPEFPGQVVWQQGRTLGIAPDEATAHAAAAACREVQ